MTTFIKGQKVKNLYNETLTVMEVIDGMVRVYEDFNNLYHHTKLIA